MYHHALSQVRRETERDLWATLQYELAECLARSQGEDRAQNLEEAIRRYQAVLEVWTRDNAPEKWAQVLHDLGSALRFRVHGNRGKNLKRAIRLYELALQVRTSKARPKGWAATQICLGIAWKDSPGGDRGENQERALKHYQAALEVWSRKADPVGWARVQHNLGNLCSQFVSGDRLTNLECALKHYRLALKIRTRDAHPVAWAMTQVAMANTYVERIRGDRAENLERAIELYQQALEVRTRETRPAEWAETQYDLAYAYRMRIRGDRAENQEKAIEHYRLALEVHTRQAFPLQWATAQTDLGRVYYRRLRGDRAENLEQAIDFFKQALEVRKRNTLPEQWAITQLNLANAYCDRIRGNRAKNLEYAIDLFKQALEVRTREAFPYQWALIQNNLGTAYWERIKGQRAQNIEQAIQLFNGALEIHTPGAFPVDARRAGRNLGNLYFEEGHWSQARDAYATAIRAAEALYRASYSPGGKEAEIAENTALYERMVRACLKEPDYAAALVAAEGGKARTFLDQMGQAVFPPPPDLPLDLLQREEKAIKELREQEQDLAALSGWDAGADRGREPSYEREIIEQRRKTLAALEAVWDEIARDYPEARSYVAMRRGEPMTWGNLCALAERLGSDAALVEFYTLTDEIVVFVLRARWETPQVYRAPLSQQQLLYRYLLPYQDEVRNHEHLVAAGRTLTHDWLGLGEHLLAPLETLLGDATLVYFVPHGMLHYLPLHALTAAGEPFIVRREVAYAPSAAVLARTLESAPAGGSSALVMGYTSRTDPDERDLFLGEAKEIATHLRTQPLLDDKATAGALRQHGPGARVIHLSCHGHFRADEPSASGVHLASGEFNTRDWMALPLRADLVTLSACETGISDVKPGDDLTGLTRALLYAGTSSALVTLWSVRADTTLKWMLDFYGRTWDARGNKKTEEALAFQQATLALRKKYPDPYYWAPFTLVGDWR